MQVHRGFEIFDFLILERPDDDDSSIVDEDIDPSELRCDRLHHRFGGIAVPQIARVGEHRFRAAPAELLRGLDQFRLVPSHDGEASALSCKLPGHGQPEPARAAGDEHGFAFERIIGSCPSAADQFCRNGDSRQGGRGANDEHPD